MTKLAKQDKALANFRLIRDYSRNAVENLLVLGQLFYENKKNEYYKLQGFDTWSEFLGDPMIAYSHSTVRSWMNVHKTFVLKYKVGADTLKNIGHRKLQIISPVISDETLDDWLNKAECLSRSDLKREVKAVQGQEYKYQKPPLDLPDYESPFTPWGWKEFVKKSPCVFHGDRICEQSHHYPHTKGAGAKEYAVIPLCGECHNEAHNDPDWKKKNSDKIADWYISLLVKENKE